MSYIYETHLHTNVGSRCGKSAPEEYIRVYKDYGFTGIVVTDHFFNGNCAIDRHLPWKEQVSQYMQGYERAKEEGGKVGLDVFFGWEARLGNDEYLTYGLDGGWLLSHPEIVTASHSEQWSLVHDAGGALVQAHPYRERDYETAIDLYPYCVDAIEGYNLCDSQSEDERSRAYGNRYHLPFTAGSDVHDVNLIKEHQPFGIVSPTRWNTIKDYADLLRTHEQLELHIPNEKERTETFTLSLPVVVHEEKVRRT